MFNKLIQKYSVNGPRYTSYPTAPHWAGDVGHDDYVRSLEDVGLSNGPLSLYIHIPFCHSLCLYCGCHKMIRAETGAFADRYVDALCREVELVACVLGKRKQVSQIHFGGGTPTFLEEAQFERLMDAMRASFSVDEHTEIAVEIDPRSIEVAKLAHLKQLGFTRISYGIQDFDPDVQVVMNRIQPYEEVVELMSATRKLEFPSHSVNFDLIYGLPGQTYESFSTTLDRVVTLKPERIALYSFAFIPWKVKVQKKMDLSRMPDAESKLQLFLLAREKLMAAGYQAIAMDHFALPTDPLATAFEQGKLHRNFMGYTVTYAQDQIGLGVSSIGQVDGAFFQNHKGLSPYSDALAHGRFPVERGKLLSRDDIIRQWTIQQLMCRFELDKREFSNNFNTGFDHYFAGAAEKLKALETDALIEQNEKRLNATPQGRLFIRNICMAFDAYLEKGAAQYSGTV